jgi:hypothetical protein
VANKLTCSAQNWDKGSDTWNATQEKKSDSWDHPIYQQLLLRRLPLLWPLLPAARDSWLRCCGWLLASP